MPALNCVDLKLEQAGVEVAYDPRGQAPGIVVRLARMNNPAMAAWQNSAEGKDRLRQLKLKHGREEAADLWFREAVAHAVVVGWSGMVDRSGALLPYSTEASVEFMTDPRYFQWQDWVAARAGEIERFLERDKEEASKNSEPA